MNVALQQSGEFATGEEDVVDASGEARLRIAYREAAMAVLECFLPNPHRPFVKVSLRKKLRGFSLHTCEHNGISCC